MGLPVGGFLLSLATLEPRKGLDVLLAAAELPTFPDLVVAVAGQPGWGGVRVPSGAASERVLGLGRLEDDDLAAVLSGATVLAMPSRAEGFGLPVLEAMSFGVPVVISDAPALVEVAGGAAVVTPVGDAEALADALSRVVSDGRLRGRLAQSGRARAAAYSWPAAADATWAAYADALA
jgi:glycosyltransferase involved in cell wall biosynthesis